MAIDGLSLQRGGRVQSAPRLDNASVTAVHVWLPYWFAAGGHRGDLSCRRVLKLALKEHGVHAKGFRIYRAHGDAMFSVLSAEWVRRDNPETSLRAALALLRLLQDGHIEAAFPASLVRTAAGACESLEEFERFPVALFRASWREAQGASSEGMKFEVAIQHRVAPVLRVVLKQWLREPPDHNQMKQGWAWVRKRFELRSLARAEPRGRRDWNAPFTRARFGGLDFLPLFNERALEEEGEQMEHCIADHFDARTLGRSHHAFSIRQPGARVRVATMSVALDELGSWVLDGLSGKRNEAPGEDVSKAAEAFMTWMNRKTRAQGS